MQRATETTKPADRLSWLTILGFGQLAVPLACAGLPIALFVSNFYTKDVGINIEMVGAILLIARFADFIVDPLIGFASDHTRWRMGRRRSWVLLGAPVFALGVFMLFMPPQGATWVYLLTWIAVFYLGWTMITIPYGAWGAELSGDYNERSRITGVREIFTLLGLAFAGSIPILVGSGTGTGAAGGNWHAMSVFGWLIMALTPVGVAIMFASTPEPPVESDEHVSVWRGVKAAFTNKPFLRLFTATFCFRVASRAAEVLFLFYMVDAVGLTKSQGNHFPMVLIGCGILFAPLWIWLGGRITKHRALCVAMLCSVLTLGILPAFQSGGYWPNIMMFAIIGAAFSAPYTLGQSIAADVVDFDSLRTHEPRAGLVISFFGLAIKSGEAIGAGVALVLVGYLGFDGLSAVRNPDSTRALTAVFALMPIMFYAPAIFLLWGFPLTPDRQRRIRVLVHKRAIKHQRQRDRRAAATVKAA